MAGATIDEVRCNGVVILFESVEVMTGVYPIATDSLDGSVVEKPLQMPSVDRNLRPIITS